MNQLQRILNERREKLVENIQFLSQQKINTLEAILKCTFFVHDSIKRTESDLNKLDLGNLTYQSRIDNSSKLLIQDNADEVTSLIPENFGEFDNFKYYKIDFPENKKMFAFIYHQLFISINSTLDDYFSQMLLLVLRAYPEKLGNKKIFQVKFNDVNNLLGTGKDETIIKSMDEQIVSHVRNLMGQKPFDYLTELVTYLGDTKLIRLEKLTYCEMCLRRNAGVHCGWFGNQEYNLKIQ